jgi:DNA-binding MarR family transcriptional regulator
MPTPLKGHDPNLDLKPGTKRSDIIEHLYRNQDVGYRPSEVSEELDVLRSTAKVTLKRLYDEEHLGKTADGYYHALPAREDLRRYVASVNQLHKMYERSNNLDEAEGEYTPQMSDEEAGAVLDEITAGLE